IVGEESLTDTDRRYLRFGEAFERRFLSQGFYENRSIEETLDIGWEVLSILPESELTNIKDVFIQKYHPRRRSSGGS
ncbi:MAG: V-type ATP synthase subunit B, partial [Sulfolobales archaeon]